MEYRINGFEQIKAFYSIVFEQKYDIKPQHISLYIFLINQNNRNNWVEWFKCPFDLAMAGASIGSKHTYYSCLNDLKEWKLIDYEKGVNNWKAPKIKIEVLKCTSTVPQSEPLPAPLPEQLAIQLPEQLSAPKYKLLTNNLKLIIDNLEKIIETFSDSNSIKGSHLFKNSPYFDFEYFKQQIDEKYHKFDLKYYHENAINYSESKGAKYKDWLAALRNWMIRDEKDGKAKMNKVNSITKLGG